MNFNWGLIAEIFSVISIVGHIFQHFLHKTKETYMLGFLHNLKPLIEGAAEGHAVASEIWAKELDQIHDAMSRLQKPKKTKKPSQQS
jgi:ABC-type proline/glycine betaine transport system substrate-binding protein